ncbi:MAG: tRNA-dihydrouridine synthase, partial [Candidatus Micrarchaeia archaeon]
MPKIGDKEISGRFTIPSGIITTTTDSILRIARDIPEIGILTTKSVGPAEKEGNREPILASVGDGTFINAVGLANPGADEFASELKCIYPLPDKKFLLTSIFGSTEQELQRVARTVAPYSDGLELNFSCPHAGSGYGLAIGSSPELTEKMTESVKEVVDIPV